VVTNPINKEAWHLAGHHFPGHTEYLVEKTQAPRHAMMLTAETITCALATTHIPLAEVPTSLDAERLLDVIRLTHEAMLRLRGRARLLMPALNPHAGEGGLFGDEEERLLRPVIAQARAEGIDLRGPLPADTAFLPRLRAETEAYVCLYHDQGLIPLKALAFDEAVNLTLGLPIVRSSVDHGTAFDIAWQGKASADSLRQALTLARKLSTKKD
ncbi:MAG: 4-hydroxythreonine-4-phosphate dehydrogenase PdxA, partial [Verrucomicrobiales bacterium]